MVGISAQSNSKLHFPLHRARRAGTIFQQGA